MDKKQNSGSKTVKIRIAKPGALRIGEYWAGKVYDVEAEEAGKLVGLKGFEVVNDSGE